MREDSTGVAQKKRRIFCKKFFKPSTVPGRVPIPKKTPKEQRFQKYLSNHLQGHWKKKRKQRSGSGIRSPGQKAGKEKCLVELEIRRRASCSRSKGPQDGPRFGEENSAAAGVGETQAKMDDNGGRTWGQSWHGKIRG